MIPKLNKSKIIILISIFCIIILAIVIINEKRKAIYWNQYKQAKPFSREADQYGMTDELRKKIFWDLVKLQDDLMEKNPYDTQAQEDAYEKIAKKYGVLESVVRNTAIRGIKEKWPKPPLK